MNKPTTIKTPLKALFVLLWVLTWASSASAWQGRVIYVSDGDTIKVKSSSGYVTTIRLQGIDCPEKNQVGGQAAKNFVQERANGCMVEVDPKYQDQYGRTVGVVWMTSTTSLNEMLVAAGHAWVYSQYCTDTICDRWLYLQEQAAKKGLGLWSRDNPTPPWEWRKMMRSQYEQEAFGVILPQVANFALSGVL